MKLFAWICGLLGVAGMAVGLALFVHTQQYLDRAQTATGVVTEMVLSRRTAGSKTYKPRIRFQTPSGESMEYVSSVGSNASSYQVGEPVTVYFDPANPSDARLKAFFVLWGFPSIACGVGAVFFLIGAGLGLAKRMGAQKLAKLRASGDLVLATFDKCEPDTGTTFNDRHPWRVHAFWIDPASGQRHLFSSEMLWEEPDESMARQPVRIYMERGNPDRYAMDLT